MQAKIKMLKHKLERYGKEILRGTIIGLGLSFGITAGVISMYAVNWDGVSTATSGGTLTANMWNATIGTLTGAVETLDDVVVKITGDQTINGTKNFSGTLIAGKIGIGTSNPQSALDINGGIKLGNDTSPCTGTNAGTTRYNAASTSLEVCNGTEWKGLSSGFGSSSTGAVMSVDSWREGSGELGLYYCQQQAAISVDGKVDSVNDWNGRNGLKMCDQIDGEATNSTNKNNKYCHNQCQNGFNRVISTCATCPFGYNVEYYPRAQYTCKLAGPNYVCGATGGCSQDGFTSGGRISCVKTGVSGSYGGYPPSGAQGYALYTYRINKAFDGNKGSGWGIPKATHWAIYDFVEDGIDGQNSKIISRYRIYGSNKVTTTFNSYTYLPKGWIVAGSNDKTTWTTLDTQIEQIWTEDAWKEYSISSPGDYRYYRFTFNSFNTPTRAVIPEIDLWMD